MNTERPLVSIIVITYNSAKFVLKTLESAKAQTYQNIELIVSDDGSTDETVNICNQWIEQNKVRFVRTELITANENTGIPANCNRGVNAAKGEWLKLIAGDDLLDTSCITSFLRHIYDNDSSARLICCNRVLMHENGALNKTELITSVLSSRQYEQLITYACIRPTIAPFVMIKKELFLHLGGFDERYRLLEDAPLFFKALKNGYYFLLIAQNLVYYRLSNTSTSNSRIIDDTLLQDIRRFTIHEIIPYIIGHGLFINALKIYLEFKYFFYLRKTFFMKILNKIATMERSIHLILTTPL